MRPHNLPFVMLGAGLLWFGWFGFNAGSAVAANGTAGLAFINTQVATSAALLGWILVERIRDGKPTTLGAASGAVAGLVAITPACAFVSPLGAVALGFVAGAICAYAVGLKYRFGYDDSLDVVGVHLVGGLVGTLLVGLLSTGARGLNAGLFYGGGGAQLWRQTIAAFAVMGYSFVVTLILAKIVDVIVGLRVTEDVETSGIDLAEHAETGYDFSALPAGRVSGAPLAGVGAGTAPASNSEKVQA
jgi:Amt family ammonium transporter